MWIIKLRKWLEALRIYARSGVALLLSALFPALEMRGLERRLSDRKRSQEDDVLRRAGKWFALLGRLGMHPSCLVRSIALTRVLREEGHDAHLAFGVRSDNGDMEGHCWVAVEGRALTEAPQSFEELGYG
ncbi:MAG: lasso peptide biosynthesis B2 protein [Actinomycetota bacterium]